MNLFRKFNTTSSSLDLAESSSLHVESLENRMMLSSVQIEASASMGGENMQVFIGGELKLDVVLSAIDTGVQAIETDAPVQLSDIRIEFTNDLYLPEQGIDRNIDIGNILIDGVEQDIDTSSTFSTGTWLPEDGVSPGFGRGTILHTNGFLQFGVEMSPTIDFQGNTWTGNQAFSSSQAFVDEVNNELVISGVDGPFALSREIAIEPGGEHVFNVEAYRNVISGSFASDNAPWSTAGINFYDVDGNLVRQETIEINSEFATPRGSQQTTVNLSDDITTAFMWIWIDGFSQGTNIPLRLSNISFDAVDTSDDTTPPQAFFRVTEVLSSPGQEINFLITFVDDRRLGSPGAGAAPNAIRVESAVNGFEAIAVQRNGFSEYSDTRQGILYGLLKPDGSDWTEADNGSYSLFLQEDSLVDAAGNVAPGMRFINQLFVDIMLEDPDTEPATISLQPIPTVTTRPRDRVQFIVNTTDNVSPAPFVGDLRITSDNGFEVTLRSIAGGFDPEINETWQLYNFRTDLENGTYTITLPEGELVDRAGNVTPSQVIGSFVVDIDSSVG